METADPVAGPSASTADSAAVVRLLQRRGPRDHQAECRRFDQSDHLGWGCTACRDRPVLQLYRYSRAGGVRIDGDLPCSLGTYRREPGGGHGWTASTGYRRTDYRSGDGEPALSRQWRPAQWSGTSGGDLDPWTQVMKGYYREPELTATTLRDGWLRTGDIGMMTFNGCLRILGRYKATIVLSSGENLEPEPIEMRLRQSPLIENCMLIGQDQKQVGVLIVPDPEGFKGRIGPFGSLEELADDPAATDLVRKEIRKIISPENGFKSHELVRHVRLLSEPFEVGEELTSLFKLRRHVVEQKYAGLIREIYSPEPAISY